MTDETITSGEVVDIDVSTVDIDKATLLHFAPQIIINLDKLGDEERAMVSLMVRDVLNLLKQFAENEE